MPKTKEQKRTILHELNDKIARAKSIIFVKYNALTVKENEELRSKLRQENNEYYVAKKTLFNLALKDKAILDLNIKKFEGQVAAIFGYNDEVSPAKIVGQFKKEKDKAKKIEFIGGILENKYIGGGQVAVLAILPSKQELYAKIVSSINAPVSGLVNALVGNIRNLVQVLKAVSEK
ncbi:MAG: 50S ribosomal protein L10 [Patescibacteria group bacterium]|nr:50S ribosomal protein L10 [Patescibacteria group bacterium]MBU1663050.1 50S ribosomal protein L10 [Patescibacteria group bacterium]MBU1933839.1 50S ribosomal protein L10 [Patescibacteria group bacterium]MBU2008059.1 50S ribosomal protein L10 [Patescibacteria group bacterium]MBU2233860.1 50S ribosomal protein L10 [Patescibacteria group bacterium]